MSALARYYESLCEFLVDIANSCEHGGSSLLPRRDKLERMWLALIQLKGYSSIYFGEQLMGSTSAKRNWTATLLAFLGRPHRLNFSELGRPD